MSGIVERSMRAFIVLKACRFDWSERGALLRGADILVRRFGMDRATGFRYVRSFLDATGVGNFDSSRLRKSK